MKLSGKSISYIIIDEPTQIKPKPNVSLNPKRESLWLDLFNEFLKDKEDETEI